MNIETVKNQEIVLDVKMGIEMGVDRVSTIYTSTKDVSKILDSKEYLVVHLKKPYKGKGMYQSLIISRKSALNHARKGTVHIAVPSGEISGKVVGKGGETIKSISSMLGLKITVRPY